MDDTQIATESPSRRTKRHILSPVDTTKSNAGPAQITPPETPVTPPKHSEVQPDSPALFHNYLRALHPFDPAINLVDSEDAALMTAQIKPGDLVLVHSIHANGWADGTVLTTGDRGWLPTNYCEPYGHPYLRNLLTAMTQFWDLMGSNEDVNLSTFTRQDYIRGLIAGVRHLLEQADCLHRDASFVQKHNTVRRMRKALLADLSGLVQIAKHLQETAKGPFSGEAIDILLYQLITKAFKVVTRAVSFVDVWVKETAQAKRPMMAPSKGSFQPTRPNTPPGEDGTSPVHQTALSASDSKQTGEAAKSVSPEKAARTSNPVRHVQTDNAQENTRTLLVAVSRRKGSITHRVSVIGNDKHAVSALASKQLEIAHDNCVSHIGTFLGHRFNSRPTSGFVGSTERLTAACKTMLVIVDEVYANDTQGSMVVYEARETFRSRLEELVRSTRDVFKFSDLDDDETEVVMFPKQSSRLVNLGTSLIRTAGQCFIKTRSLIEQIGDFELENCPLVTRETRSDLIGSEIGVLTEEQAEGGASPAGSSPGQRRVSQKILPPPPTAPPSKPSTEPSTEAIDFAMANNSITENNYPASLFAAGSRKSLPQLPIERQATIRASQLYRTSEERKRTPHSSRADSASPVRKDSVGISIAGSVDTVHSDGRDSAMTAVSEVSTRATTPEQHKSISQAPELVLFNSFASLSSMQSGFNETERDTENQLLQKTYANELVLNRDGQVAGGSLHALVEQLTIHDAAPDPRFLSAFYITFRIFTAPREFAKALIERFEYIGDSRAVGQPVRLRVYNIFKGWLETHWDADADADALGDIRYFALQKLKSHLPSAGDRLYELTRRVSDGYQSGTVTGPLVSGVGKTSMSIGSDHDIGTSMPEPIVTKGQLNALRAVVGSGASCGITDLEPLEVARQLTLLTSKIFCDIQPHELLGLEWTKKSPQRAPNVRKLCGLNTDLAHVVGDTILAPEEAKKRALIIKHWAKIAMCCLQLSNYDSLVAIMCSLNSSVVQRLKRTWVSVSKNTRTRIEELNKVVDFSRNQASLRSRLEAPSAPCLPFLGIYLTDLTFVDAGNQNTRELPGSTSANGEVCSVINFDKYMRTAKIISLLQRFQVPYKLQPVPEMQAWMEAHMERMRASNDIMVGTFHRRSLVIEPKDGELKLARAIETLRSNSLGGAGAGFGAGAEERPKTATVERSRSESTVREKFGTFLRQNTLPFKREFGTVTEP